MAIKDILLRLKTVVSGVQTPTINTDNYDTVKTTSVDIPTLTTDDHGESVSVTFDGYGADPNPSPTLAKTIIDYVSGLDAIVDVDLYVTEYGMAEATLITDALSFQWTAQRSLSDSVSVTDSLEWGWGHSLLDTAYATDYKTFSIGKALADTAYGTDSISWSWSRHLTPDQVIPSDSLIFSVSKVLSDQAVSTDALVAHFYKVLSDSLSVTDSLSTAWSTNSSATDSSTATDSLVKSVGKVLSDTAVATDSLGAWGFGRALTETATASDAAPTFVMSFHIVDIVGVDDVPSIQFEGEYLLGPSEWADITDALAWDWSTTLQSETVSATDAPYVDFVKGLVTDTVYGTDSASVAFSKGLVTETAGATDALVSIAVG